MSKIVLLALVVGLSSLPMMASQTGAPAESIVAQGVEISLFPNPTNGVFYVDIRSAAESSVKVKVVNMIGQTLREAEASVGERLTFDMSNSPKGVYFLQIGEGSERLTRRIVVQ
ncbi:MAG: T9SS C-terminal target domain-containing protein [Bacteroidetes bacterium]|jgi:Secretion system C-terminal sorting domain|nr:MAG: T9SS C-terminal target domain-containing protein [Bacteroidota bacterium]